MPGSTEPKAAPPKHPAAAETHTDVAPERGSAVAISVGATSGGVSMATAAWPVSTQHISKHALAVVAFMIWLHRVVSTATGRRRSI